MNRRIAIATLAIAGPVLLAACSSGGSTSASESLDPAAYCTAIAPVWDPTAVPNFDDDMSGAERATAITAMKKSLEVLPQGVALKAITQAQSDLLIKALPLYLAMYEDPTLVDKGPSAAASAAGLSSDDIATLNSPENNTLAQDAINGLGDYCKPSAPPSSE